MKKLYSTFAFALLSLSATGAFAGSKIYVPTGNSNQVMDIDVDQLSIKATTTEKLGFVGTEQGISAHAIALIYKK